MIDQEYTDDQKKRAEGLAEILFDISHQPKNKIYDTEWGRKTSIGIINTILYIMYSKDITL